MKKENIKSTANVSSNVAVIEFLKKIGYVFIIIAALLIFCNFIPSKKVYKSNFVLEYHEKNGVLIMAEAGGYIRKPLQRQKLRDYWS